MLLPKGLREQTALIMQQGNVITLNCEDYHDAAEIVEWILEQLGEEDEPN